MIIAGIILIVFGLLVFMTGGALTNDNPGIERTHLALMGGGFVLVIVGAVLIASQYLS